MKIKNFFIFIAVNILNFAFTFCMIFLLFSSMFTNANTDIDVFIIASFVVFSLFLLLVFKFFILSLIYKFMKKDNFFKLFLKDIKENIMTKILYIGISFVFDVVLFLNLCGIFLNWSSLDITMTITYILEFYYATCGGFTILWLMI